VHGFRVRLVTSLGISGRQWQSAYKVSGIDVEPVGDLDDGLQPKAALAALNLAQLGPVDTAANGCGFLTESKRHTPVADPFTKRACGLVEGWLRPFV
jgi:hypothetical protein